MRWEEILLYIDAFLAGLGIGLTISNLLILLALFEEEKKENEEKKIEEKH